MKETIYTIPINDAFDSPCSCPVCHIENQLEQDAIDAALGAAMMEPDFRINTNEKGFCRPHYRALLHKQKALPLALVLQTHSAHQNEQLFQNAPAEKSERNGLFKKESPESTSARQMIAQINQLATRCAVCEKVQDTMRRYYRNIIYLWKTQEDFRKKFAKRSGFCLPHFAALLSCALEGLPAEEFKAFYHCIVPMQQRSQAQIYEDISAFAKLFDHQNSTKPTEQVKNAVKNAIQKYSGLNCEND